MPLAKQALYDVIIAGSGPAGIATAIHLVKLNPDLCNRLLVLEKDAHPRTKICGGGIGLSADDWLRRMGCLKAVDSLTMNTVRFIVGPTATERCGREDGASPHHLVWPGNRFRSVVRHEFDAALAEEARAMGIGIVSNEPLTGFGYEGRNLAVTTSRRRLFTRILVGADGVHSLVRRTLAVSWGGKSSENLATTLNYLASPAMFHAAEHPHDVAIIDFYCTFRAGVMGYAWSFPFLWGGQMWLNTGVGCFRKAGDKSQPLRRILLEFLTTRGISFDKQYLRSQPIRWFDLRSHLAAPRVLLVGDAAGVDPFWGEGISICLGSGHAAAQAIHVALLTKEYSFADYSSAFLRHETGQQLASNLRAADRLYRSSNITDVTKHLLSVLSPSCP